MWLDKIDKIVSTPCLILNSYIIYYAKYITNRKHCEKQDITITSRKKQAINYNSIKNYD